MWKQFITNWNGGNFFLLNVMARCRHSSQLFTDASGTLCYGGIFGTKWFQGTWEPSHQIDKPGISIAWQEFFAIVIACQLWGSILCNKRLICNCNESVVKMINSKCSKVPCVMYLLCYFTLLTLKFNLYIHSFIHSFIQNISQVNTMKL